MGVYELPGYDALTCRVSRSLDLGIRVGGRRGIDQGASSVFAAQERPVGYFGDGAEFRGRSEHVIGS